MRIGNMSELKTYDVTVYFSGRVVYTVEAKDGEHAEESALEGFFSEYGSDFSRLDVNDVDVS